MHECPGVDDSVMAKQNIILHNINISWNIMAICINNVDLKIEKHKKSRVFKDKNGGRRKCIFKHASQASIRQLKKRAAASAAALFF